MIAPYWALLLATASVAAGDFCNRRIVGWLPDDPPRPGRKLHARPIPLAGVLIAPTMLAWCIADAAWLATAGIVIVAALGFEDDRRKEHGDALDEGGLDWRIKALGLAVAAALVAATAADPLTEPMRFGAALALTFLLTNAINFLDNTDGVAASLSASALLCIGYAPHADNQTAQWVPAAGFAALGFLPWNWPRPRLFLGDGGAYALGLACSLAIVPTMHERPVLLLCCAVPLIDFAQVVTARIVLAVPPWVGDRRHLTHILHHCGVPKVAVAPIFAAVAAGLGIATVLRWS